MIRIDDSLLEEIGLIALPKADRDQLLRQIYETLEMKVGMRLAERMSDQQLDEFERFIDTNDEAGALKWLETNFPDYKQVVADELEKLKVEIKRDSPRIIEAMQANPAPQQVQNQGLPQQPAQQFSATPQTPPQPMPQPQQPWAAPQPSPVSDPTPQNPVPPGPGTGAVSPPPFPPAQDPPIPQPPDNNPPPPPFPPAA